MAGKKKKPESIPFPIVRFYKDKDGNYVTVYQSAYTFLPDFTVRVRSKKKKTD